MTLTVNHSTPADGSFSATGATAWNASHTLSGTIDVANGGTGVSTLTGVLKGNGTSAFSAATAGTDYQAPITLTTTGTSGAATFVGNTLNIPQYTGGGGGSGTVTTVSVVSANGLAGTVANATTTPAITLSTSITGVLKGNGTAISAATANTDYQSPITLTTTGTSGAATFNGTTLNIPQYTGGGGGGTPGGSTTQIQYNNAGAFAGSANLVYDGTNVQVNNAAALRFSNATTNYVSFKAPATIGSNVNWTLPSTDGTAGQVLSTNGSGILSWVTVTITPQSPTNNTLPVVSGTTTVGQTLSSTSGTWNGYPAPTFAYQWVRGAATNISGATSSTYQLVDADYNTTVKCTVTATNSAGSASATSAATATIAAGVPGAPTIGTATGGNAEATVSFTAPAITGGVAITGYTVTSSPGGLTATGSASPLTVTGLTNGTAYTFTVTATNSVGTGPASAASNSVTPAIPVAPTSVEYLVIAGGGGGGNGAVGVSNGGGGGAGGFRTSSSFSVTTGTPYTVTVGAQGPAQTSGSDSVFSTITSTGGGRGGGAPPNNVGASGGSGGGGAGGGLSGGGSGNTPSTSPSQGNNGGNSIAVPTYGGGGGGGAAGVGSSGATGNGGTAQTSAITGTTIYYAGGGGAALDTPASSGLGGGTAITAQKGGAGDGGATGGAGTPNTGGAGGGGLAVGSGSGGAGGSGVVIIAYPSSNAPLSSISGGLTYSVSTVSRTGYRVYTFTAGTGPIQW